jgi:hypothetical protein
MRPTTNLASLLALVSSAMSACGGSGQTTARAEEDAAADSALDAPADGPGRDAVALDVETADARDAAAQDGCSAAMTMLPDGACTPISVRRPFLVGASLRSAVACARRDWAPRAEAVSGLDPTTCARLAQVWLADALEEHASVAAFARFTMLLLSVGAPPELAVQSQRASIDEVRHAEACFALAARYGGHARGPSPLSLKDALRPMSLAEIAALTAQEGCVGETLGAVLAREQVSHAVDPAAHRALTRIARDEERHAALAWRFTRWAVLEGGDAVRAVVAQAAEEAVRGTLATPLRVYDGVDVDAWLAYGRVTCAEARQAAVSGVEHVVRPALAAALAA